MKLEAYTDAGFKDGVSTHHWRIVNQSNWVKKRYSFKANEVDNNKAEMQSINSLVQYLNKKDITDIVIYTDSMYVVRLLKPNSELTEEELMLKKEDSNFIKSLKWDLKGLNARVEWISREAKQIKLADYYCSQLLETVFKRKEYKEVALQ